MPLLAFNLTTSDQPIIAGVTVLTTVPKSAVSGTPGKAWDVTKVLQPAAAVDPINGATGGRTAAELAAIQAALAGLVLFRWTGSPEYLTDGLAVVSPDFSSAPQALSGPGAVSLLSRTTLFTSTGVGDALTLANGLYAGQRKTVYHTVAGGSGVLTPTTAGNFATVTFNTIRDWAELEWSGSAWNHVSGSGAVVA